MHTATILSILHKHSIESDELVCCLDKDTDLSLLIKTMSKNGLMNKKYTRAIFSYIMYKCPENFDLLSNLSIEDLGEFLYHYTEYLKRHKIHEKVKNIIIQKIKDKIENIDIKDHILVIESGNNDLQTIIEDKNITGGIVTPHRISLSLQELFHIPTFIIGIVTSKAWNKTILSVSCKTNIKELEKYIIIPKFDSDKDITIEVDFNLTKNDNIVAKSTVLGITGWKPIEEAIRKFFGRMKPHMIWGGSIDKVFDQLEQEFPKKGE